MKKVLIVIIVVGIICFLNLANAYELKACGGGYKRWQTPTPITLRIDPTTMPSGGSARTAFERSLTGWNDTGDTYFYFSTTTDSGGVGADNSESEIYFTDLAGNNGVTTCWLQAGTCYYDECDVAFDSTPADTISYNVPNEIYDYQPHTDGTYYWMFRRTAAHEVGHVLGLSHEDDAGEFALLHSESGPRWVNEGTYRVVIPLADDRAGVRALYGGGSTTPDIAVNSLKDSMDRFWCAPSEAPINDNDNLNYCGQDDVLVCKGGKVAIKFVIHNLGTTSKQVKTRAYFSLDDAISTSDTGSNYWTETISAGEVKVMKKEVDVPESLTTTRYYVGVIADYDDQVANEQSEENNKCAFPTIIEGDEIGRIYVYSCK